jgi:MFS family permease
MDESYGPRTALDAPGLTLITVSSLGLVWGLVRGNSAGWGSLEVVGAITIGLVLGAAFVAWERRSPTPMLPMRLFRAPAFGAGNAANFFQFGALFSAVFFIPQFLQTGLGHGPLQTGLLLLPWTGTVFIISPISGALVDRIGERPLVVIGLLTQAAGFLWIALIAKSGMTYSHLIAPLVLAGAGISISIPPSQNAVVSAVEADDIGKASGTFSMMRQMGGAFGLAVVAAVFAGAGSFVSPHAFSDGFTAAIAVSAALSLAGAVTGLAIPGRGAAAARGMAPARMPALEGEGA